MQKFQITVITDDDWDKEKIETAFTVFDFSVAHIKKKSTKRTSSQNAGLHKWLGEIEEDCKEKGLTLEALFKEPTDIPITKEYLKDFAKKTTEVITGGDNKTSKLTTKQFSLLIETLIKVFGERLDNQRPFPCIEDKLLDER